MNLKQYIEQLSKFMDENNAGDMEVIYSMDDEGNGYYPVYFGPSVGHFNPDDHEWMNEDSIEDWCEGDEFCTEDDYPINSVCIN